MVTTTTAAATGCTAMSRQQSVPVTPAIWTVAWTSMTVGFLQGIMDSVAMAVLVAPGFMQKFFPDSQTSFLRAQTHHLLQPDAIIWCAGTFVQGQLATFATLNAIGAVVGAFGAAWLSAAHGRRTCLRTGCWLFILGIVLTVAAFHSAQLIIGSLLAGIGLGMMMQATLLEDAEVAPARFRGTFTSLLELGYTAGAVVIFGAMEFPAVAATRYGWRLVLTMPLWPAGALLLLLFFIPETPSSLIQRGFLAEGQEALRRIRGPFYSSAELSEESMDMWAAAGRPESTDSHKGSWLRRQLRTMCQLQQVPPMLVVYTLTVMLWFQDSLWKSPAAPAVVSTLFNYTPANKARETLLGGVSLAGTIAGVILIDKRCVGRRGIFIIGSIVGLAAQAVMCGIFAAAGDRPMSRALRVTGSVMYAINVAARGWSWPAWTASTTENFSLCSRSMLVALAVAVSYAVTAVTDALSALLLCKLHWGNLVLLMAVDVVVLVFAWQLLPEAAQVPIEKVQDVCWRRHPVWQRLYTWLAARQLQQSITA